MLFQSYEISNSKSCHFPIRSPEQYTYIPINLIIYEAIEVLYCWCSCIELKHPVADTLIWPISISFLCLLYRKTKFQKTETLWTDNLTHWVHVSEWCKWSLKQSHSQGEALRKIQFLPMLFFSLINWKKTRSILVIWGLSRKENKVSLFLPLNIISTDESLVLKRSLYSYTNFL